VKVHATSLEPKKLVTMDDSIFSDGGESDFEIQPKTVGFIFTLSFVHFD